MCCSQWWQQTGYSIAVVKRSTQTSHQCNTEQSLREGRVLCSTQKDKRKLHPPTFADFGHHCTSGISWVLAVASLQLLKMEALIPAPAVCEVWSVIELLNAQSTAPIEIHRQPCQVFSHTRLDSQHVSWRSSAGRYLIIIYPITDTSRPVISIFSYTLRNHCPVSVFRMTERRKWVSQWFQSQVAEFYCRPRWSSGYRHCIRG